MNKHLALIIDDEPDICELLEITLKRMDIDTLSAGDLKTAYKHLNEHKISICLTDMRLPDGNGLELVKVIQKKYSHIPVAMISAHGNMDTAIEALKSGAFDFVSKPVVLAELRNLVNAAIKLAEQNDKISDTTNTAESPQLPTTDKKNQLIGSSTQIEQIHQLILKLSKSQAPVFISGESGTGKELAARLIHQSGPRENKTFVPINCGAIPSELMESEFFGHKKGSFTGAIKDKIGLFQAADGGTLFLDEVADLPLNMQVKLLRAIQEKAIKPVGAEKEHKIDVRVISATHKDLKFLVDNEQFRQDLYYRINVIELQMPNLRGRKEDITLLADYFLAKLSAHDKTINLSETARGLLSHYPFPGNVRELENILERAVALCENNTITETDLQLPEHSIDSTTELSSQKNIPMDSFAELGSGRLPGKEVLIKTLDNTKWNRKAAASLLGITYRQLRYRLKKLGLE
ncbi:MAG: sigma-54 dependent transcriptional regulator [Pseudomonadota bacterium]